MECKYFRVCSVKDSDVLYHGIKKGREAKKHKYVARIETQNGKYRYFYSNEEYKKYLNNKSKKAEDSKQSKKSKLDIVSDWISSKASSAWKKVKKLVNKGRKIFNKKKNVKLSDVSERIRKKGYEAACRIKEERYTNKKNHKYVAKIKGTNGKYRYFYSQHDYDAYMKKYHYLENEPDFMKDVAKKDPDGIAHNTDTKEFDMANVNEEYSPFDDARSYNCAYCTTAYELRQRGYDVQAADFDDDTYYANAFGIYSWYKNGDMRYIYSGDNDKGISVSISKCANMSEDYKKSATERNTAILYTVTSSDDDAPYSADSIEKALSKEKNARGNFCVYWSMGGGHSMVYETNAKGKVTIRDCQTNDTYTVQDIVDMGVSDVFYMRTDNLELSENILDTFEEN